MKRLLYAFFLLVSVPALCQTTIVTNPKFRWTDGYLRISNGNVTPYQYVAPIRDVGNGLTLKNGVVSLADIVAGATGPAGANGKTILSGTTVPSSGVGTNGDYYYNITTTTFYGPKTNGSWPAGLSLVGPTGAVGSAGTNGNTILSGTGTPSTGTGVNGDYYLNYVTSTLYGPKTAGAWPAGIGLTGPSGSSTLPLALESIYKTQVSATIEASSALYVPAFTDLSVQAPTNLAIHSSGVGIVGATAGTAGSGSAWLPKPIDPTQPFRAAVLIELNDSNILTLHFADAAGDTYTGARLTTASTTYIGGQFAGSATYNQYGQSTGIPAGTKFWFGLAGDGTNVYNFLIPYSPDGFAFNTTPGFQAAWANTAYCSNPVSITALSSGHKVFGDNTTDALYRLAQIKFTNASTTNRIVGVWMSQGLNGPSDDQLKPPFMMRTTHLQDGTGWLVAPGGQGSSPLDLVMVAHPNASNEFANINAGTNAAPQLAKLFQAGYAMFGILGTSRATSGLTDATASNWGGICGDAVPKIRA